MQTPGCVSTNQGRETALRPVQESVSYIHLPSFALKLEPRYALLAPELTARWEPRTRRANRTPTFHDQTPISGRWFGQGRDHVAKDWSNVHAASTNCLAVDGSVEQAFNFPACVPFVLLPSLLFLNFCITLNVYYGSTRRGLRGRRTRWRGDGRKGKGGDETSHSLSESDVPLGPTLASSASSAERRLRKRASSSLRWRTWKRQHSFVVVIIGLCCCYFGRRETPTDRAERDDVPQRETVANRDRRRVGDFAHFAAPPTRAAAFFPELSSRSSSSNRRRSVFAETCACVKVAFAEASPARYPRCIFCVPGLLGPPVSSAVCGSECVEWGTLFCFLPDFGRGRDAARSSSAAHAGCIRA